MVKLSDLQVGKQLRYVYGPVTREGIAKYAFASGDRNNIHIDDNFAEKMGLKGVIAHGLYSLGMVARSLGEIAGYEGRVVKLSGQMRGMVRPGDDWIITFTVKAINGDLVDFDFIEESKTPIIIEKDGKIIKKFEAEERRWIENKDMEQGLIKTEETADGILHYRLRTAIPGTATLRMVRK